VGILPQDIAVSKKSRKVQHNCYVKLSREKVKSLKILKLRKA